MYFYITLSPCPSFSSLFINPHLIFPPFSCYIKISVCLSAFQRCHRSISPFCFMTANTLCHTNCKIDCNFIVYYYYFGSIFHHHFLSATCAIWCRATCKRDPWCVVVAIGLRQQIKSSPSWRRATARQRGRRPLRPTRTVSASCCLITSSWGEPSTSRPTCRLRRLLPKGLWPWPLSAASSSISRPAEVYYTIIILLASTV